MIDERRAQKRQRCLKVLAIRQSGATWAEVGRQMGISGERARQLGLAGLRFQKQDWKGEVEIGPRVPARPEAPAS